MKEDSLRRVSFGGNRLCINQSLHVAQCLPETYKLPMYTFGLRQFIRPFQCTRD